MGESGQASASNARVSDQSDRTRQVSIYIEVAVLLLLLILVMATSPVWGVFR